MSFLSLFADDPKYVSPGQVPAQANGNRRGFLGLFPGSPSYQPGPAPAAAPTDTPPDAVRFGLHIPNVISVEGMIARPLLTKVVTEAGRILVDVIQACAAAEVSEPEKEPVTSEHYYERE